MAVYLINDAALGEFDRATRRLIGDADLIVRGPPSGFDESAVRAAGARSGGRPRQSRARAAARAARITPRRLPLLALDPFRAAALQTELVAGLGGDVTRLFAHDAIVLSRSAADELGLQRGDTLRVVAGSGVVALHVVDVMPAAAYPERSASWTSPRRNGRSGCSGGSIASICGCAPGVDPERWRASARSCPPGVLAVTPRIERGRAASATRAYRVNLNMLALVALLTGAFLVFSTQSLAVLRRRAALALLRALGVTRAELQRALWSRQARSVRSERCSACCSGRYSRRWCCAYLQSGSRQPPAQRARCNSAGCHRCRCWRFC